MRILEACVITVIVETALFRAFGYRKKDDLIIVALANVISNLALNLIIATVPGASRLLWVLLMEAAVVIFEYLVYRRAFGGGARLFVQTFAANCVTYGLGLLLQSFGLM